MTIKFTVETARGHWKAIIDEDWPVNRYGQLVMIIFANTQAVIVEMLDS